MSSTDSHAAISIAAEGPIPRLDNSEHDLYSLRLDLGNVGMKAFIDGGGKQEKKCARNARKTGIPTTPPLPMGLTMPSMPFLRGCAPD